MLIITVYLRAVKELILEGEMKNCEFLNQSVLHLGSLAKYFLVHLGVANFDLAPVKQCTHNVLSKKIMQVLFVFFLKKFIKFIQFLLNLVIGYAKEVRKRQPREIISYGDTTFALDLLPLEIVHLIVCDLDYETLRSLFSVSKAICAFKTRFSDAMYDEISRKEFPIIAANTTVKGRQGYLDYARCVYVIYIFGIYTIFGYLLIFFADDSVIGRTANLMFDILVGQMLFHHANLDSLRWTKIG